MKGILLLPEDIHPADSCRLISEIFLLEMWQSEGETIHNCNFNDMPIRNLLNRHWVFLRNLPDLISQVCVASSQHEVQ